MSITKIFRFETAHAIHQYMGSCKYIHGHSYELHVTVKAKEPVEGYLKGLGILFDFKELKSIVQSRVTDALDHKLLLSKAFLAASKNNLLLEEVVVFEEEPTAENILILVRDQIQSALPGHIDLHSLKLWETRDSYAEWSR